MASAFTRTPSRACVSAVASATSPTQPGSRYLTMVSVPASPPPEMIRYLRPGLKCSLTKDFVPASLSMGGAVYAPFL